MKRRFWSSAARALEERRRRLDRDDLEPGTYERPSRDTSAASHVHHATHGDVEGAETLDERRRNLLGESAKCFGLYEREVLLVEKHLNPNTMSGLVEEVASLRG